MKTLIDVHSHLLPGIDDGADSWETALAMAAMSVEDGVSVMVATPHMMPDGAYANRRDNVLPLVQEANDRLQHAGIPLEVVSGGELYAVHNLAEQIASKELLTYGDQGRCALVEMPALEIPPFMERILFEAQVKGVTLTLAHPERNAKVVEDLSTVANWIERGGLVQVNARSLLGESGRRAQQTALELIHRRMVHLVASDAHSVRRRPPGLAAARRKVADVAGEAWAKALFETNPRKLLDGEPLEVWEPLAPKRGSWLGRLLRPKGRR